MYTCVSIIASVHGDIFKENCDVFISGLHSSLFYGRLCLNFAKIYLMLARLTAKRIIILMVLNCSSYNACCDLGARVRLICYVHRRLLGLHEMILKAHKRANHIISCFNSGDINLLAKAFIVYAQPILDYNSIMWSPYLK